jgi:predicted nucleotidyltransferase
MAATSGEATLERDATPLSVSTVEVGGCADGPMRPWTGMMWHGSGTISYMTLEELRRLRPALAALAAKYGLTELAVFGSTARGDATPASDVDLMYVRGPKAPKGLAFLALQSDLEELLGRKVDLVPKDGLHWVIRDRAIEDAEILYAA